MKIPLIFSLTLLSSICQGENPSGQKEGASKALTLADLKQGVASLTEGKWQFSFGGSGPEQNHTLTFYSDGLLSMRVTGNVSQSYAGAYRIDDRGAIHIELANLQLVGPPMNLVKRYGAYYLERVEDSGGGGAPEEASEMNSFEPYKLAGGPFSAEPEKLGVCPVCDYAAVADQFGASACRVCFWQGDYSVEHGSETSDRLEVVSKVNFGLTITQARRNFSEMGACHKDVLQLVVPVASREQFKQKASDKR